VWLDAVTTPLTGSEWILVDLSTSFGGSPATKKMSKDPRKCLLWRANNGTFDFAALAAMKNRASCGFNYLPNRFEAKHSDKIFSTPKEKLQQSCKLQAPSCDLLQGCQRGISHFDRLCLEDTVLAIMEWWPPSLTVTLLSPRPFGITEILIFYWSRGHSVLTKARCE